MEEESQMPCISYLEVILELTKERRNADPREAPPQFIIATLEPRRAGDPSRAGPWYLELEGALGALSYVLVEALLGVVGQLEGNFGGAARPGHQQHQQQREQPAAPTARGSHPTLRRPRPRHPEKAAASTELR